MNVSSEQNYDTLSPETTRYQTAKDIRRPHRPDQARLPAQMNGFQAINGRPHDDMMGQTWLSSEPPASYLHHGYPLGGMHSQQHMPTDFRLSAENMMQEEMQDMSVVNGLPLMNSMCYEGFPAHTRGMPTRTMSTPHHLMLDHSDVHANHGLGASHPAFYSS